jgi:hypothetical protein
VQVIEAQSDLRLIPAAISGLVAAPKILWTGIGYRTSMLKAKTRFRTGFMVSEARGEHGLESVGIAPIGANGRATREKTNWVEADTLVAGYGLMPSTETAKVFGCRIEHDPALSGMAPWRNENLETDQEAIYAIGDGAGIGGVEVALLEGKIAAHSILGTPAPDQLQSKYRHLDAYRRKLNLAYRMPRPLVAATDETIICRCEELSLGRLRADLNRDRGSLNALKTSTRLGMGRCQGRNCLHTASSLMGFPTGSLHSHPRARPPIKPISVGLIAADQDVGPAFEPDEVNPWNHKD